MQFTKLVPEIYYNDIKSGLKTFVDCLEFRVVHSELDSDNPFCVVGKDGLSIMLFFKTASTPRNSVRCSDS